MTDQTAAFEAGDDSNTHPKAASNEELQQRVANVIHDDLTTHKGRRDLGLLGIVPRLTSAVLAELKPELDRLAEYENTINWMTTCTGCARVLDSCIRETERRERAEAALARIARIADEHPAGIDTALIHEALDGTQAPAATPAADKPA